MRRLTCGEARASVSLHGAELRAWSVGAHNLLWEPDPTVWDAVAPVLFPIVGWPRDGVIRVDGQAYAMGVHGFAAKRAFRVVEQDAARVTLEDGADPDTLRFYPFAYRLTVTFTLAPDRLSVALGVANEGATPMPYAVGLHPGFRWPPSAAASLAFETREATDIPVITDAGLFSTARRKLAFDGRHLRLTRDDLSREALCFLATRSRRFVYEAQDFGRLQITHEDMPHLALWSRPPAPFLCLESWTGHGDPDGFDGELRDKPSMRILAPGGSARHAVHYAFTPNLSMRDAL